MDISWLTDEVLKLGGIALLALASFAVKQAAARLHLKLTAEQGQLLTQIASNGIDLALSRAGTVIKQKGWDHPDVKSQVVTTAYQYLRENAAGGLAKAGIDVKDRAGSAAVLQPVLERMFADGVTKASASPATPAVVPPPGPVS